MLTKKTDHHFSFKALQGTKLGEQPRKNPSKKLLILGAGLSGKSLALAASASGIDATLTDDRPLSLKGLKIPTISIETALKTNLAGFHFLALSPSVIPCGPRARRERPNRF